MEHVLSANIIEEHGYFWWEGEPIPEGHLVPDSSVSGILTISKNGQIDLELHGILETDSSIFNNLLCGELPPEFANKSIHGILKNSSKFIHLFEIHPNGGTLKFNGVSFERYRASDCLVGSKPLKTSQNSMKFSQLRIDLNGLEEWLRLGAIETKRTRSRIYTKYKPPKDKTYHLHDAKLSIRYRILCPTTIGTQRAHKISQSEAAHLELTPKTPIYLDDMKAQFKQLEDLLMLITNTDFSLDWPQLRSQDKDKTLYQHFFRRNRGLMSAPSRSECWTDFSEIQNSFGDIFSSWRQKQESFGPGFYLYLGTIRNIQMYVEHRFVNLIWGLESLHRRKASVSSPPTKLEVKIQRILDAITDRNDKKWLENRLKTAHEPSLEERIFQTLEALPLNINNEGLRVFAKKCANSRNDISHFGGQRNKDTSYTEFIENLHTSCEALTYLYHILILHEIGIDEQLLRPTAQNGNGTLTISRGIKTLSEVGIKIEPHHMQ